MREETKEDSINLTFIMLASIGLIAGIIYTVNKTSSKSKTIAFGIRG